MSKSTPQDFMRIALNLAEKGRLSVSPNPMVGCVIVKDGQIIGQGFHEKPGCAHAEVNALQEAGIAAKGASVYLSLEPCCHHGKTPPCTNALIAAGIKQVFVACLDPNPLVAGKGIETLRHAGIPVEVGLLETEAKQLNCVFFHYITTKTPFVTAKWAMSLDGKTITPTNDDKKISNESSHQHAHQLRQQVDAILIGSKTAISDNPLLTVRYVDQIAEKQPIRIVLASKGQLAFDLHLFSSDKTIIATTDAADPHWLKQAKEKNIDVLVLPANRDNQVDLHALLIELGKRKIASLLVEGGMTTLDNFFKESLINQVHVYLAPTIIGAREQKQFLPDLVYTEMNGNHHFTAIIGDTHVRRHC